MSSDPTATNRDFNGGSNSSCQDKVRNTDPNKAPHRYSNLPNKKNLDYQNKAFLLRYLSQGAQKKTGFRSLKNVDNLKLNTKPKKEGARDTINSSEAYDSPFEETPTKSNTKGNRASQKEFLNMSSQNL